ncbi:Uncharacterised protein [Bordetella pertussis]|nr:Uncharacterised protein [Bordetella pertussis]CFP61716.1 Uncharacterised protein [Bordetella pertussis]
MFSCSDVRPDSKSWLNPPCRLRRKGRPDSRARFTPSRKTSLTWACASRLR